MFFLVFGKKTAAEEPVLSKNMQWLVNHTQFGLEELERLQTMFKKDYPRGGMFRSQFAAFFPPGLATIQFCDHVFRYLLY